MEFGFKHLLLPGLLLFTLVLAGCSGDDGAPGAPGTNGANGKSAFQIAQDNGFTGTEQEFVLQQQNVGPESCQICHNGTVIRSGGSHQADYDELFQQGVVVVDPAINYLYDGVGLTHTVTFQMTKNGLDFDCTQADGLSIGYSAYTADPVIAQTGTFTAPDTDAPADGFGNRVNLKGTVTYDAATNTCTSVIADSFGDAAIALGDLSLVPGIIAVYGQDELVTRGPAGSHLQVAKFPFAALLQLPDDVSVDYLSAANATGCEKCHTKPYYKHGFIIGDVGQGVGNLDFYTCKVCHIDNGLGGHQSWQLKVDNPQRWAELVEFANAAGTSVEEQMTQAEKDQYEYKTRLMNDVHMSHSMEFPYPQSIRNCATCHDGKLAQTLSDANFVLETCRSCHPVTGGTDLPDAGGDFAYDTRPMALITLMQAKTTLHDGFLDQLYADTPDPVCTGCHNGSGIPSINQIHTGYDPIIYAFDSATQTATKYADAIIVSIDSVKYDANGIDISFSANGAAGGLDANGIVIPSVQVSFYGYDTKDFLVSNHSSDANNLRMEFNVGDPDNALFTTVKNTPGSWEVILDPTAFALPRTTGSSQIPLPTIPEMIADGIIKKAEVAVLPRLLNADGNFVGLNAPSKTIDVTAFAADPSVNDYYSGNNALVSVEGITDNQGNIVTKGCNSCHDVLGTTFHNDDSHGPGHSRGGNIVVCRMCHVVTSGGSHLEGQSRSIDSYVHAIHRFQAFDVDNIDFNDPVEAALYEEHISFLFPDFFIINCQACHTPDRAVDNLARLPYDVPDQSKSMPGLLSGTDEIAGRNILATPPVIVGPAARACGACHRAEFIKEDDAGGLTAFNQHTKTNGYRVENDSGNNMLYTIISFIMNMFK